MNKKIVQNLMLSLFLLLANFAFSQNYVLPNEVTIFSFETQSGKKMVLAKDKNQKYIIYRFGTKSKIEFEFPEKTKESWKQFKYAFYMRGGGIENDAKDLNYLRFSAKGYHYEIYDTYYSDENKKSIGITVTNTKDNKTIDIKGKNSTRKGDLSDFRFNELLEIEED